MSDYIRIADKLYNDATSKYSGTISVDINEDGIRYLYYNDNWDYTAGKSYFFVERKKIEELLEIEKYNL